MEQQNQFLLRGDVELAVHLGKLVADGAGRQVELPSDQGHPETGQQQPYYLRLTVRQHGRLGVVRVAGLRNQIEVLTDLLAEDSTGVLITLDVLHQNQLDELRQLATTV